MASCNIKERKCTFFQVVDFEGGHLLGKDGLGEVKQCRVIDWEVAVVLVQNPHSCPLDAALHQKQEDMTNLLHFIKLKLLSGCVTFGRHTLAKHH